MKKAITILVISLLSCISIHTPFARTIKGKGFDKDSIPYSKDEQRGITTMDLLMKYKWLFLDTDYFSYTQEFTTTSIYDKMEFPNQEMIKGRSSYYLSNSKARRFNNKKRGVKKNGKYIKEKNWGAVVVSEILEINDTSLIIRETRFGHIARFKAMPK